LRGWIFFEVEHDLRGQLPIIKAIEITLKNSTSESQIFKSHEESKGGEAIAGFISSADWHLMEGYYDLTQERAAIAARIDLPQILKGDEGWRIVNPNPKR
jgi:hypothetical protein